MIGWPVIEVTKEEPMKKYPNDRLTQLRTLWTGDKPDGSRVRGEHGLTYAEHQELTNLLIEEVDRLQQERDQWWRSYLETEMELERARAKHSSPSLEAEIETTIALGRAHIEIHRLRKVLERARELNRCMDDGSPFIDEVEEVINQALEGK